MANEDSILREVDQELAEDDLQQKVREYGPAIAGAAAAIVVGVAGWQFWTAREDATAKAQALEFNTAVELLEEDQDAGRVALNAVGEEGGGYGVLARLQAAASYARGGERLRAIEIYRSVYSDGSSQRRVRDFARLRAAYLSLSDGRDEVLTDLGNLAETEGPFSFYAQEISALAALGAEDYQTAESMFRELTLNLSAPAPVRTRAEDFAALAAAGKAGVNITGETRVDDLLRAVGDAPSEAVEEEAVEGPVEDETAPAQSPEGAGTQEAPDDSPTEDSASTVQPETSEPETDESKTDNEAN